MRNIDIFDSLLDAWIDDKVVVINWKDTTTPTTCLVKEVSPDHCIIKQLDCGEKKYPLSFVRFDYIASVTC